MPTPSMEDYLERIYKLIDEKGYARVSDIAEGLEVHPSSVTKMIQKLDKDEYLIYEKYRGLVLTSKGKKWGNVLWTAISCWRSSSGLLGCSKSIFIRMLKALSIT